MLKTIALENFVHFKDKTVIDFDKSQSKATLDHNAVNIFVGANFCGKSTILELIRRCMTEEINVTVTNSFDDNFIAYAFCKFSLQNYGEVISGIVKKPGKKSKVYKVFIFAENEKHVLRLRSLDKSITYDGLVHTKEDKDTIQSIFSKSDIANSIHRLLDAKEQEKPADSIEDEPNWKTIEDKYVSTLPLRGIGIVQWTKSENIKNEENYETACERAEVISTLLSEKHKNDIDEKYERDVFQFITYPERFEFKKDEKDGLFYVKHNKSKSQFPLLKTSEGILEAKLTSLLLAHKDIQTLCLEEPDRGMHPQMIERLRTVMYVHETKYKKTIIVVTHSPYLIDTITIEKTHVFFRKETTTDNYECSVRKAMREKKLSKVSDIETLRTLLFSTKVLLVEGVTDREVVEGIFTHIKREALAKKTVDVFNEDITTYQVIPVHGSENIRKIQSFCKYINLTCLCLWDLDKVVKFNKETRVIKKFLEIDKDSKQFYNKKYRSKPLSSFIDKDDSLKVAKLLEKNKNTFIWRHGAIEDAILSSNERNKEICKFLNCKNKLKPKNLKYKLTTRLDEEERKGFYAELVKVDEIDRFLKFIKEKEGMKNDSNEVAERSVKGLMPLLEDVKTEGFNQSSNPEVQVPASGHTNEPDKENDPSPSMISTKKSDSTNLQTQIDNQNSKKSYASVLKSNGKSEKRQESNHTKCNDLLSGDHYNKETKSDTGYLPVSGKRRTKRIVLSNIDAREKSFEDVKTEIKKGCDKGNVNVSNIICLAHHSKRKFPIFVICANIDFDDYEKTKNPNFWPNGITVRDWIPRTQRDTKLKRS